MPQPLKPGKMPLALLRTNAGLTLEEAGRRMMITADLLKVYEDGSRPVPSVTLKDMAQLYRVPFEEVENAVKETKNIASAKRCFGCCIMLLLLIMVIMIS